MPKVIFKDSSGQVTEVEAKADETLLQIGLDNNVPIEHACGGNGFCTTCMCEVEQGMENLSERNEREEAMGITEGSNRLGCQAKVQGDVTVKLLDM